ncbi:hypothetical protein PMAYCL1PPCAC_00086, partial [Pristionchus mayeri]
SLQLLVTQVALLSHEILDWPMHRSMMGSSHRSPLRYTARIFHVCVNQKHMVGVPRSWIQFDSSQMHTSVSLLRTAYSAHLALACSRPSSSSLVVVPSLLSSIIKLVICL